MHKIEIKKVVLTEIEKLQKIGKQTFIETFSEANSEENMKKYLNDNFTLDKLTELPGMSTFELSHKKVKHG